MLCLTLFLKIKRHQRSNRVKKMPIAALRMFLQCWLVPGDVCCPAALPNSPARPYGQQETLLLCLPLGLLSSVLPSSKWGACLLPLQVSA